MQTPANTSSHQIAIKVRLPKNIEFIANIDKMDGVATSITSVTGGVAIAEAGVAWIVITPLPMCSPYISCYALANGSLTSKSTVKIFTSSVIL
jgi:hypothetical protein